MHNGIMPENPNDKIDYTGVALKEIYLAGGCFWGEEAYIRRIAGVCDTECGYANGKTENPTYEELCAGGTDHSETVRVRYAPSLVSLKEVLEAYFETTDVRRIFPAGDQYRNGVYFTDPSDEAVICAYMDMRRASGEQVEVEVLPLTCFYEAEEYHQDYLEKNPNGFCHVDLSKLEKRK